MRGKYWLSMMALAMLFVSCGKDPSTDPDPEPEPEPTPPAEVHFSILGDSFSTYLGYVYPASNDVWYHYYNIGVTSVEQMWWYQLGELMDWTLDVNNSFSGSLVCNMNYGGYYGPHSFLRRMNDLGNPDVILVFGGTNDVWDEAPMGDYVYWDWTEEELCGFRPALACLFDGLLTSYPDAEVVFMADTALGDTFMQSVHTITEHYGIQCVDLVGIEKDWKHPSAAGMTTIATQMAVALRPAV